MDQHKNLAYSLVATAPSPATSGTSLVVTAAQGTRFPTTPFNATIWPVSAIPTPANAEIVRVTTISTDTFTITRAQEGTSARTVVVGDQIAATITALTLTDAEEAVQKLITQSAHGLAVGDVVRHNGTNYVKAQANSAANAEVVGIVELVVDSNNFVLHSGGRIAGLSGLTAGTVYFLDDDTAGLLTATEPGDTGDISKPLLVADSTTSGWFFNWRGSVVSAGPFPGYEFGYTQITSPVSVTGTSAAAPTDVVSSGAIVYDGTRICIEFYTPRIDTGATSLSNIVVQLWDDTTDLGNMAGSGFGDGTRASIIQCLVRRYLTPSAASHTYRIRAYRGVANGTIQAGAGGVDTFMPAYIRVTAA